MEGTAIGPYRLLAELGSGGMGTVHAAEVAEAVPGLEMGQKVAVKVIHPHLLATPGFFRRFLREAELGRKVVHENVVRTFDVDAVQVDDRIVHYMVMEHVRGRTLRQLLEDLGRIPETLLREIALQATAGLAAIHEAGIVHRDLKPENVLITDDHEIRIMDLGVAKLQEASIAITPAGQFAGSLLYAAPEQFGAGAVGPSADLYSLGVVLYELATGDNPFWRDSTPAAIEAQLKLQPPRITDRNTDMTSFFAELVAKLLAKRPTERFASAQGLHDVLAEAERSPWWTELAPKAGKTVTHLPRIRVRRETELHGRDGDLRTLNVAWARAKAREGNTVFVEGEAGIGKTRLVDAFLRGLGDKDIHVLYGSYPPSGGLDGIADAILDKFGDTMLSIALARYLTVTPSLVPAFAALVQHESPPTGAEPLHGDALNAVCVHLMRALAEEKPLVWIVEDLQFAPREGRDTVLALARAVEGHRVLLVATARPGVPEEDQAHLSRLENFQRVSLHRLGAREVAELLEGAFKSEALAEKLGMRIAKKSDGVPFFIFEMIRGLKEGRLIKQQADGTYAQTRMITDIEVPSAVKDLIEGRLRGLTRAQRAILDVGAAQGMSFDPRLVAAVLEQKKVRVLQEIAEMERHFGLVRGEAGSARFDQNQIQEVVYQDLIPDLRAEYHTLLAAAHAERVKGQPTGEDTVFLASHYLRGSCPEECLPHLTPALEHLERSYRNEAAIELAARALDAPELLEGKERVEALLKKAGRHGLRGEREAERASLDEALALADGRGDAALRAKVRKQMGWHRIQTSDYAAAQDWSEQARDLAREAEDRKIEASATGHLGNVFLRQGRYKEARAQFEKSLALAREIGDREGEASATGNLGFVFSDQGRHEEASTQFEKSLALAREIGNRRGEAVATGHLGIVRLRQGRYEEARALLEKHLALAREIGDRRGEAVATGNLGVFFFDQGRYGEAGLHYETHLALSRLIGDRSGEATAIGNLGIVLSEQGRYEEARAQFEKSLALAREIGSRQGEAVAAGFLGNVLRCQGRYEEARAQFEKSLALAREIGDQQAEGVVLVNLGPLHADLGQTDLARKTLDESLLVLRGTGARRPEGAALEALGSLADQRGEIAEARRLYEEALALRKDASGVASTLVALGRLEASQGEDSAATAYLEEAHSLAEGLQSPNQILLATVELARLAGGDVQAALDTFEEHEERVDFPDRLSVRFRLWELTRDRTHLAEAKRLLDFAVEHAPEDCRDSMIENVPLHRDIMRAWEDHGGA
ncbi:MAG: tetratricopeptide repeat protein [Planctomycetota bacterium]